MSKINPDDIIPRGIQLSDQARAGNGTQLTPYSGPYESRMAIPKYQIPQDGAPGDTVYAMIKDELDLDGRPTLNLAR